MPLRQSRFGVCKPYLVVGGPPGPCYYVPRCKSTFPNAVAMRTPLLWKRYLWTGSTHRMGSVAYARSEEASDLPAPVDTEVDQPQPEDPLGKGPPVAKNAFIEDGNSNKNKIGMLRRLALVLTGMLPSPAFARHAFSRLISSRPIRLGVFFVFGLIVSLSGHLGMSKSLHSRRGPQEVLYSDFLTFISSGNISHVRFEEGTGRVLFDLKPHTSQMSSDTQRQTPKQMHKGTRPPSQTKGKIPRQFYTRHVADPHLISALKEAGVPFGSVKASFGSVFSRIVATALALWVPLIPMFILMRRFMDGRSGSSKKKNPKTSELSRVTFSDVAGVDDAKLELQEVVECLRDSSKFNRLGARLPSGVLLCGPPGTGKTLLAKAVAGEAGVPFLAVSASEFVELFVGRGAARVRELFAEARKRAPCVVFIDELDAIGGKRGAGLNEERDQTLNQLLTELDGFEGRPGVVLLAATNRADVLDPALLRPGRLSRKVNVPLPNLRGRAAITRVHLRGKPIEGGVEGFDRAAEMVALLGNGLSGAELGNVVNEAAFLAARRDSSTISVEDLQTAVFRTRFGINGSPRADGFFSAFLDRFFNAPEPTKSMPLGS